MGITVHKTSVYEKLRTYSSLKTVKGLVSGNLIYHGDTISLDPLKFPERLNEVLRYKYYYYNFGIENKQLIRYKWH